MLFVHTLSNLVTMLSGAQNCNLEHFHFGLQCYNFFYWFPAVVAVSQPCNSLWPQKEALAIDFSNLLAPGSNSKFNDS